MWLAASLSSLNRSTLSYSLLTDLLKKQCRKFKHGRQFRPVECWQCKQCSQCIGYGTLPLCVGMAANESQVNPNQI